MSDLIERISVNAQSSVRIDCGNILRFDPFVLKDEPHDADVIFITHAHHDHFSALDLKKVSKPDTLYVAPSSMRADLDSAGFKNHILVEPGESGEALGFKFTAVPAYNIGRPFHTKESRWVGYVVEIGGEKVYVSGDTDGLEENSSLGVDIAIIPIGGKFTMDAAGAAEFINKLEPKIAIPTHFGGMLGNTSADREFIAKVKPTVRVVRKLILENKSGGIFAASCQNKAVFR